MKPVKYKSASHVVWWFETDLFGGKTMRAYRSFWAEGAAYQFFLKKKCDYPNAKWDRISKCPWHHQHARIPQFLAVHPPVVSISPTPLSKGLDKSTNKADTKQGKLWES